MNIPEISIMFVFIGILFTIYYVLCTMVQVTFDGGIGRAYQSNKTNQTIPMDNTVVAPSAPNKTKHSASLLSGISGEWQCLHYLYDWITSHGWEGREKGGRKERKKEKKERQHFKVNGWQHDDYSCQLKTNRALKQGSVGEIHLVIINFSYNLKKELCTKGQTAWI